MLLVTLIFIALLLVFFYLVRMLIGLQRKKRGEEKKKTTEVGFVVDTFHDLVSKLKEKEKELEAMKKMAEERASSIGLYNENILQSVPSGVVSFDRRLNITKINSSAEKILDMKQGDVVGKSYREIFGNPVAGLIEKRETVERGETAYVTRTGKRIWLGLSMSPLRDGSDAIIGRILVFTDLSELKAFQSQMELRERLSTLGEMSAGIAHELRNPMAVISGYTKILMKKVDDASKTAVEAIAKEVSVMDRIVTDFLSFAKPVEPAFYDVDLNGLIEGCISGLSDCMTGITVVMDMEGLQVIVGDEVLLRQSFTNLIRNAVEAMTEGGELRITAKEVRRGESGVRSNKESLSLITPYPSPLTPHSLPDFVEISVSDTGHGVPESMRDKIFLPFFTTKERGTGLGLSIVHKTITSHGGSISMESCDKGTTFRIKLPRRREK